MKKQLFSFIAIFCGNLFQVCLAQPVARQEFTCPNTGDGFYGIPGQCTADYYYCLGGSAYPQQCAGELVFDPATGRCVPLNSASCQGDSTAAPTATTAAQVTTTTTPSPTTTTPTSTTTATTTTTPSTTTTRIPSTSPTTTPRTTASTTTSKPSTSSTFQCPDSNGFFPIPGECSGNFYTCVNYVPELTKCPGNAIFDPAINTCVANGFASCQTTSGSPTTNQPGGSSTSTRPTGTPGSFTCPEPFGYYSVPGQVCSRQFIHCSHSTPYYKTCPEGTIWNQPILVCDWPYNVEGC